MSDAISKSSFQERVRPWMLECFGPEIANDRVERGDRFCEEALELLQASGYDRRRVLALVDYVFNRPAGEITQETGGVLVTLAAFCLAHGIDMHAAGETELARIWTKVDVIRAKQATKPTGSALPVAVPNHPEPASNRNCYSQYLGDGVFAISLELWSEMANAATYFHTVDELRPDVPKEGTAECREDFR
jgi:NTP pyrophosphatase (non-canonical NTP hydrolase)